MKSRSIYFPFLAAILTLLVGANLLVRGQDVQAARRSLPSSRPATNGHGSPPEVNIPVRLNATESITVTETFTTYLPIVDKRWPPIPDIPFLNSISNPDGDGNYTVSWKTAYLADTYTLEEDDNANFTSPVTRYHGTGTSWAFSGKPAGTFYYRVRAENSWGPSPWSEVQSVSVTLLFFDNFSNSGSGWAIGENAGERWRYTGGRYEGAMKLPGYVTYERAPVQVHTDYYSVQAEIYPISRPTEGSHGLVFGLSEDWKEYYIFVVDIYSPGYYRLDKRSSGGWTELRGWTVHNMSAGHVTLKVERKGNRINLFINGTHVDTLYDGEFRGTRRVGVAVSAFSNASGWVVTQYDDFELRAIGDSRAAQVPASTTADYVRKVIEYPVSEAAAIEPE